MNNSLFTKKFFQENWSYLIPVICSFLFFWKIGVPSYWFDELVTVNTVHPDTTQDFLINYIRNEVHPPLYFFVLKFYGKLVTILTESSKTLWLVAYNYFYSWNILDLSPSIYQKAHQSFFKFSLVNNLNNTGEVSIRLISAIAVTLANIKIFSFFKQNGLLVLGIFMSVVVGLNNRLIFYAQDARPYALFTLISIFVFIELYHSYYKEFEYKSFRKLIILNVLLLLTHYYAIFVVLAELLLLAWHYRRNRSFLIFSATTVVLFFAGFKMAYDLLGMQKLSFVIQNSANALEQINYNAFGHFLGPIYISIVVSGLLIKWFVLKKYTKVDQILVNVLIFSGLIFGLIYCAHLLRPVLHPRYVTFLIPLQFAIFACSAYSVAELIAGYIPWPDLGKALLVIGFTAVTFRLVYTQYVIHFFWQNYYDTQKYYPIKTAYQKIRNENQSDAYAPYVLEEALPQYFSEYEKRFKVAPLVAVHPQMGYSSKEVLINETLKKNPVKVFYYVRANKDMDNIVQRKPLIVEGYKKDILFVKNTIQLFKFTKLN